MLTLLQPFGLLAGLGIAIPVIIHLWNVRQGKTLKIGSIKLLKDNSSRARKILISEKLLLSLRCFLIFLVALLLSQPYWQRVSTTRNAWILTEPGQFKETYRQFKKPIDSLLKTGAEWHAFDTTFRPLTLSETIQSDTGSSILSYPSLLRLLQQRIPAGTPVYLYTTNRMEQFTGAHFQPAFPLTWKTITSTDSVKMSLRTAWLASPDSVCLWITSSSPSGTVTKGVVFAADAKKERFRSTVKNGTRVVEATDSLPGFETANVELDTSVLRVGIYPGKNEQDARYLSAALLSIRQFTRRQLLITTFNQPTTLPPHLNWLFWLDETAPAARLLAKLNPATKVFAYAEGKPLPVNEVMKISGLPAVSLTRVIKAEDPGNQIWSTGSGNALLTRSGSAYRFYSRFNPAWNDLVWNGSLPEALLDFLVTPDLKRSSDQRRFTFNTYSATPFTPAESGLAVAGTDTTAFFWILAMLVFALERAYSSKRSA